MKILKFNFHSLKSVWVFCHHYHYVTFFVKMSFYKKIWRIFTFPLKLALLLKAVDLEQTMQVQTYPIIK